MEVYSQADLARYCDVSRQTIRRWHDAGKIPDPIISHAWRKFWTVQQADLIKEISKTLIRSVPSESGEVTTEG